MGVSHDEQAEHDKAELHDLSDLCACEREALAIVAGAKATKGPIAARSQGRVDTGGRSGLEDATAERPSRDQGAMATLRPYGRMQLM